MKAYKILMIGPAYGHNIKPFLAFYNQQHEKYALTFAFNGKDEYSSVYQNIEFISVSSNLSGIFRFIKTIRKPYHIIWHHGGYSIGLLFLIHFFHFRKSMSVINIWGPVLLQWAITSNIKGKLYKYFLKKADIIQCNWFGTKKQIDTFNDVEKNIVLPWGIEKSFFQESIEPVSSFTKDFINQIPANKTIFFYPKSIIPQTCHEEIVGAANLLVEKGVRNFIIYFWLGNLHNKTEIERIRVVIAKYKLEEQIKIVFHDFIPFNDIKAIWDKMDVGFMLVEDDQLSTALLEPLMMKKELIASDIFAFQSLLKLHPTLELELVQNVPELIATQMQNFINGNRTPEHILESRKKVIEKEFNFEKNIQKMMNFYQQQLKNKND